jgi:hypothetical protein
MKVGDKVWVLCEVVEGAYRGHIECKNGPHYLRPLVSEVKPVEPRVVELQAKKEPTEAQKIAERTLKAIWATQPKPEPEPVVKQSLTTESDPINPSHYKQGGIEDLKKARWYLDRLIQEEESK